MKPRKVWQEELDSHILDCADELVQLGYDRAAALQEAKVKFGDVDQVAAELARIHPWLAVYADWIGLGVFICVAPPLYLITQLANTNPIGFYAEGLLVWWCGAAVVVVTIILVRWSQQIFLLETRRSWWLSISLGLVAAVMLTAVLDINNYETAVYNAALAMILAALGSVLWPRLNIFAKQVSIYCVIGGLIWMSWREQGIAEHQLLRGCSYLRPSALDVHTLCEQIAWYAPRLLLLYGVLALAIGMILYYLGHLWADRLMAPAKKGITTLALVLLPLIPFYVNGVNSTGAIDVIPWKQEIDEAYINILGRHPEEKDYTFYGYTRSYEHMSEVRAVLYASEERRIKITMMYENILGRTPTTEELDTAANSYKPILEIRNELKAQVIKPAN